MREQGSNGVEGSISRRCRGGVARLALAAARRAGDRGRLRPHPPADPGGAGGVRLRGGALPHRRHSLLRGARGSRARAVPRPASDRPAPCRGGGGTGGPARPDRRGAAPAGAGARPEVPGSSAPPRHGSLRRVLPPLHAPPDHRRRRERAGSRGAVRGHRVAPRARRRARGDRVRRGSADPLGRAARGDPRRRPGRAPRPDRPARHARAGHQPDAPDRAAGAAPAPVRAALRRHPLQPPEGADRRRPGGLRAARGSRGAGREPVGAAARHQLLGARPRGPERAAPRGARAPLLPAPGRPRRRHGPPPHAAPRRRRDPRGDARAHERPRHPAPGGRPAGRRGKIALAPDYVESREPGGTWLRGPRGGRAFYPEPPSDDCSCPYDAVYYGAK